MKNYLRYPSLYDDDVIKYFLDPNYISKWDFINTAIETELKNKDEMCFNLIKEVSDLEEE